MMTPEEKEILADWPPESSAYDSQARAWRVLSGKLWSLPEAEEVDNETLSIPGVIKACRIVDRLIEKGKKNES